MSVALFPSTGETARTVLHEMTRCGGHVTIANHVDGLENCPSSWRLVFISSRESSSPKFSLISLSRKDDHPSSFIHGTRTLNRLIEDLSSVEL